MKERRKILITGCGGPMGVNVTRSLQKASKPLVLIGTDCNPFHLHLSLTERTFRIPPASQMDAYVSAMKKLVGEEGVDMILPTHPVEVRTVSANRNVLGDVRTFLPAHDAILTAQDKWKTHQCLRDAGVAVPRTFFINSPEDLKQCFEEIPSRPVWTRGSGVPGAGIGLAALPCRKVEHAQAWVDHWNGWGKFMASEYLPGANWTWCGLFQEGRLVAAQGRERLEYVIPHVSPSGITGAPAVTRTVSRKDLRETGEKAIRTLTSVPHGVFFVDFKADEAGAARVTEINAGRFGTTIHFLTEAGCNFPDLLQRCAFGDGIKDAPWIDPIPENTYWIRTLDCGPILVRDLKHDG